MADEVSEESKQIEKKDEFESLLSADEICKVLDAKYKDVLGINKENLQAVRCHLTEMVIDSFMGAYMKEEIAAQTKIDAANIVLKNGRVGEDYQQTVVIPAGCVQDWGINGLEEIGLKFTKSESKENEGVISGVPSFQGDTTVSLWYKHNKWLPGSRILERKLPIAFNPDPRSLWKNIPTPETIEYYKKDNETAFVTVPSLNGEPRKDVVAASQRGRSHAQEGKPRDDHFSVKYIPESDWYILTVADGAGSAKYSRKGSWIACDAAVNHIETILKDPKEIEQAIRQYGESMGDSIKRKSAEASAYNIVAAAAFSAYKKIKEEAEKTTREVRDYSTTLMIAICKKFSFGWFIAGYWVGDGAMAIYQVSPEGKGTVNLLGKPDGGEYAGQTRFVTMSDVFKSYDSIASRVRVEVVPDFKALMLMTDGVSDAKFETDARLNRSECWDELWSDLSKEVKFEDDNSESQYQLLKWLDFWSPGNHDDRTIAILY